MSEWDYLVGRSLLTASQGCAQCSVYSCAFGASSHITQAEAQETPLAWHCLNSRYGQKFTLTHILEVLSFLSEPPSEEESRVNQLWPFFARAVQEVSIDFFY